jgi:hypothetical protein
MCPFNPLQQKMEAVSESLAPERRFAIGLKLRSVSGPAYE